MKQLTKKKILESCIDVKDQKVVSLSRLAEVLGVPVLSKQDIAYIVEKKKGN